MPSHHTSRTALAAVVLAVFGLVLAGLASPASAAPATGKVKGVVSIDGKPVKNARVQVYRTVRDVRSGEDVVKPTRVKTDSTDSKGRYSVAGITVRAGYVYTLVVTDRTGRTVKTSRPIAPRKGRTIAKNVRVKAAGILRGTVTTSDGRSPAGLTVGVDPGFHNPEGQDHEVFYPEWSTTVKADGTWALKGLVAGQYDELTVSDGLYAQQCFDFGASALADCDAVPSERRRIQVAAGDRRTLPPVTVTTFAPRAMKLSGKVTDASGRALEGIAVRITSEGVEESVVTRGSGRFTLDEKIPAGAYTIRFDDPAHVWASQYLGGGPDLSVRKQTTVTPGQAVRGLDARLRSISTAKIATKTGRGSAKVAFRIKRKASGGAPGGTLTLSSGSVSRTVGVTRGRATLTLTGLAKGYHSLVATYSGTASTAGFSKVVKVSVK